jgi:hypothetical protein
VNEPTGPPPKLVADEMSYDFGQMDQEKQAAHTFEIGNAGPGDLTLKIMRTSCGCTSVRLNDLTWNPKSGAPPEDVVRLAPNEKASLEMSWNSELRSGPFSTSAQLITNDPDQAVAKFVVSGQIAPVVELTSRQINIRTTRSDERTIERFRIYSRVMDDLELAGVDSSNPLIHATFTRLAEPEQTMEGARIAYEVIVEITPGLPQGPIHAQLTLHTNCEGHTEIMVPVVGRITGDVLVTPSEDLDFKIVSVSSGATLKLFIKVRGEEPFEVRIGRLQIPDSLRDSLQIDLVPLEKGKNRYQLTAQLARGAPGGPFKGVLELNTTHPRDSVVRIPIRGNVIQ